MRGKIAAITAPSIHVHYLALNSFMNITKRAVNESVDQLAVIALSGFAHRSSFLFKVK